MTENKDMRIFRKKMGSICFALFISMMAVEFVIVPLLFLLNTRFVSGLSGSLRHIIVVVGVIAMVFVGVISFIGSYRHMMKDGEQLS